MIRYCVMVGDEMYPGSLSDTWGGAATYFPDACRTSGPMQKVRVCRAFIEDATGEDTAESGWPVGKMLVSKDSGVEVTRLTESVWSTQPRFLPGRGTIVMVDPRNGKRWLGPKWAVEAVAECMRGETAEKQAPRQYNLPEDNRKDRKK